MRSTDTGIRLRGVSKRYPGEHPVTALDGIDVDLAPGAAMAVMGASGSGKSTLLHVLAGLTGVEAGSVCIAGTDLAGLDDRGLTEFRRRRLGIVFQSFNLLPVLDLRDNVALPLVLDGVAQGAARQQAQQKLDAVGLAARASHYPDQLSGGEQQRAALARALITDPALILADEPTGNLDSANAAKVCALLADLHRQHGRSLVVVTHAAEVARHFPRVLILADGRIVADLTTAEVGDAAALARRYHDTVSGAAS